MGGTLCRLLDLEPDARATALSLREGDLEDSVVEARFGSFGQGRIWQLKLLPVVPPWSVDRDSQRLIADAHFYVLLRRPWDLGDHSDLLVALQDRKSGAKGRAVE